MNFLYDDIVHALHNTIDSCINSATDRRGYVLERRFTKFSEITQCNGHYAVQSHSRSPILIPGAFKPECNGRSQFREDTGKLSRTVREFNLIAPLRRANTAIDINLELRSWLGFGLVNSVSQGGISGRDVWRLKGGDVLHWSIVCVHVITFSEAADVCDLELAINAESTSSDFMPMSRVVPTTFIIRC